MTLGEGSQAQNNCEILDIDQPDIGEQLPIHKYNARFPKYKFLVDKQRPTKQ